MHLYYKEVYCNMCVLQVLLHGAPKEFEDTLVWRVSCTASLCIQHGYQDARKGAVVP